MKNKPSISVCMSTYNGEKYVLEQIKSILNNIADSDELIIVDDFSNDKTVELIYNLKDKRIKLLINNKNSGEVFSFNRALSNASNNYIFLSDQDDIWFNERVKLMIQGLQQSDAYLLTSNFSWIDQDGKSIHIEYDGVKSTTSNKYYKNILDIFIGKTNYFGCAMLISKDFLKIILPIPKFTESHDLWIALCANLFNKNLHINNKTFFKRSHESNATSTISNRNLFKKIWSRCIFLISIIVILKRRFLINVNDTA